MKDPIGQSQTMWTMLIQVEVCGIPRSSSIKANPARPGQSVQDPLNFVGPSQTIRDFTGQSRTKRIVRDLADPNRSMLDPGNPGRIM